MYSREPAVKLRFFNMDSLLKLNDSIRNIDTLTKYLNIDRTAVVAQLNTLQDSLSTLDELIAGGREDLGEARASVADQIAAHTSQQEAIGSSLASLNTEKTRLAQVVAVINSGKVLLREIEANGRTITFEDSATSFALPLNMNTTSQVYYLEVANRRDTLELTYAVEEDLNERSFIRLIATHIQKTENHSFDSVNVHCKSMPEPCSSDETTVNVYF